MSSNLSFITNEENQNLKERFRTSIKETSFFDCLVGYFYSSSFYTVNPALDNTDKTPSITKDADYLDNRAKQAQVKEYEKQINRMVYERYGLTEEEIRIVEGETE